MPNMPIMTGKHFMLDASSGLEVVAESESCVQGTWTKKGGA